MPSLLLCRIFCLIGFLNLIPTAIAEEERKLTPQEIQAELDRRQELLQGIVAAEEKSAQIQLAQQVRLSEQLLLNQEIPRWLEQALLDEHVGLLKFLADYFEFTEPARTVQYRQEAIAALVRLHGGADHWQISMLKALAKESANIEKLSDEQRNELIQAREFYQQGQQAFDAGNVDAAAGPQQACVEIYDRILGRESVSTALALRIYGLTLLELNQGRDAASVLSQAAEIAEKTVGPSPLLVGALGDAASGYYVAGDVQLAMKIQFDAARRTKEVVGTDHEMFATAVNNLALYMSETGNPHEALRLAEEAGKIYAKLDDLTASEADNSNLVGNVAMAAKEYEKGLNAFLKASRLQAKARGMTHPHVAVALGNASQAALLLNRPEQANALITRAMEIVDNTIGRDDPLAAQHLVQYATVLREQNQMKQAKPLIEQACQLLEREYGRNHPQYAKASLDLAVIYFETGNADRAEAVLVHAAEVFETSLGPKSLWLSTTLSQIAVLQSRNQNNEMARQAIQVAGQIAVSTLEKENPKYANYLRRAAVVYQNMEEYGLAKAALMEAVEIAGNEFGEKHPEYAMAISALGTVLLETEEQDRGSVLLREGEKILTSYLGREHPETLETMLQVARAWRLRGDPERAIRELIDLEAVVKEQLGSEHEVYADVLVELGRAYLLEQDREKGEQALIKAGNLLVEQLGEESPPVREIVKLIHLARSGNDDQLTAEVIRQLEKQIPELAEMHERVNEQLRTEPTREERLAELMERIVK